MAVEIEAIAVEDIDGDLQPTGRDQVRFKDGLAGARKHRRMESVSQLASTHP